MGLKKLMPSRDLRCGISGLIGGSGASNLVSVPLGANVSISGVRVIVAAASLLVISVVCLSAVGVSVTVLSGLVCVSAQAVAGTISSAVGCLDGTSA